MARIVPIVITAAALCLLPVGVANAEPDAAASARHDTSPRVWPLDLRRAVEAAPTVSPPLSLTRASAVVQRRGRPSAGPSIGSVGLGAVGGLSEFEIGPSFRYWINERVGVQAHLGFGGDQDFIGDDVEYLRFEPTLIVAIGDFGNDALNVRPYAGGGLRVFRTDIGNDFDDTTVKPAGVGGVEFGFRGAPRFKASVELSVSGGNDLEDFNLGNGPSIGGARVSALAHYFFD
ncbi:hypothetical protein TBR22_A52270 [Luteitalea sp. TBR-22]|uniref:hypothetical protein n=1 Tax=Luteitalea sp. TBR-22 TaxID=2802971 RepID=UPI001AF1B1ED|nr:hypothetical protein [Luteitalea sp. TBR-22]BCS35990.1 hypothetical protein TBR22_A52270 [Luteitalea sp. TBR-22]